MRSPDLIGRAGRAWNLSEGPLPEHPANISHWLVNVPGQHYYFSYWGVSLVHLRDLTDGESANRTYPEAGYEMVIYAINPTVLPEPDPDRDMKSYPFLPFIFPFDLTHQFDGPDDSQARGICLRAIRLMAHGCIPPGRGYRAAWSCWLNDEGKYFRSGDWRTEAICRVCCCSNHRACPVPGPKGTLEGCWWVEPDLCSACAGVGSEGKRT